MVGAFEAATGELASRLLAGCAGIASRAVLGGGEGGGRLPVVAGDLRIDWAEVDHGIEQLWLAWECKWRPILPGRSTARSAGLWHTGDE